MAWESHLRDRTERSGAKRMQRRGHMALFRGGGGHCSAAGGRVLGSRAPTLLSSFTAGSIEGVRI